MDPAFRGLMTPDSRSTSRINCLNASTTFWLVRAEHSM